MQARIFKISQTPTQSALSSDKWSLEIYETDKSRHKSDIGWTSTNDTASQVKLVFSTKEKAINYAKERGMTFYETYISNVKRKSRLYSQNFVKKRQSSK
jgi:hypothetical protein